MKLDVIYNEDCLEGMRRLPNNFINLIYIDPPFCTQRDRGYKDKWKWDEEIETYFRNIKGCKVIKAYDLLLGKCGLFAYLVYMYIRLKGMYRILCESGSIYVHCDYRVNAYLRLILDDIFGREGFRNQIVWYYTNKIPDRRKRLFTNATDYLLFYSKHQENIFNTQYDRREKPIKVSKMKKVAGKKIYEKDELGKGIYIERTERMTDNVWRIPLLHAQPERLDFPTQKPEALLERIIKASSNEGDLVADFFCGSGTTCAVAEKLRRRYLGFEIKSEYCEIARKRLTEVQLELIGIEGRRSK